MKKTSVGIVVRSPKPSQPSVRPGIADLGSQFGEAGSGFFQLAKNLRRNTSDILVCWIDELKRVHGHWSNSRTK